jgi:hypothetical protein
MQPIPRSSFVRPKLFYKFALILLSASAILILTDCGKQSATQHSSTDSTNFSVVPWSPFSSPPKTYDHLRHLAELKDQANLLIANNKSIFRQNTGDLPAASPFRQLFGIPVNTAATFAWWPSGSNQAALTIRAPDTRQDLGDIIVNTKTGRIDSAHDVPALFVLSQIKSRLRQLVPTSQEALRLFGPPYDPNPATPAQERAHAAVLEALFLL